MLIGNKVFPYPLLRDKDSNTDYKTTQFCFDFEMDNGIPMIVNGNLILLFTTLNDASFFTLNGGVFA